VLGHFIPRRHRRWPLILFAARLVAMRVRKGELGALWPLGLALFGVLVVPGIDHVVRDLGARRLVAPPAGLLAVLASLPRSEERRELPSSLTQAPRERRVTSNTGPLAR